MHVHFIVSARPSQAPQVAVPYRAHGVAQVTPIAATHAAIDVAIASYVPRSIDRAVWAQIGPWCRATVRATHPENGAQVSSRLKTVAQLALWAYRQGIAIDTDTLLRPSSIYRYRSVGMRRLSERSRATELARLRQIARIVAVHQPWPPDPPEAPRSRLSAPYADADVERFWRCASLQATPLRRRAMSAALALTLGAGLRGPELWDVTGTDITYEHDLTVVTVAGPPVRRVPVRRNYAELLSTLAATAGDNRVLGSRRAGRDRTSVLLSSFEVAPPGPPLSATRLRSTWIHDVLTGPVIVADVLAVAGISSARALSDILSHDGLESAASESSMKLLAGHAPC